MTGGIYIRESGLGPEIFIAVFYSGLGASLLLAGILFGRNYFREISLQKKSSTEMLLNYRKGEKYYAGFWRNFI